MLITVNFSLFKSSLIIKKTQKSELIPELREFILYDNHYTLRAKNLHWDNLEKVFLFSLRVITFRIKANIN